MNVVLKPELQKFVDEQVTTGRYPSAEDVVAAAVTRFMQDERLGEFAPGELDALLAEGEADLQRGDFVTMDEVREHFRRRAVESRPAD